MREALAVLEATRATPSSTRRMQLPSPRSQNEQAVHSAGVLMVDEGALYRLSGRDAVLCDSALLVSKQDGTSLVKP